MCCAILAFLIVGFVVVWIAIKRAVQRWLGG